MAAETAGTGSAGSRAGAPVASDKQVVITRVLNAPRELVFDAWTDPRHVAEWWGPGHGFTNSLVEMDVRQGGAILIHMRAPDGTVHPNKGVFHEIARPERLVFTLVLVNDKGDTLIDALNTVTFAEQDGKTKLTLNARVVRAAPEAAGFLVGMEAGWSGTLDRLAEHVASAKR
jgi:uncharacterized protein YndB with AHSA1/START domain